MINRALAARTHRALRCGRGNNASERAALLPSRGANCFTAPIGERPGPARARSACQLRGLTLSLSRLLPSFPRPYSQGFIVFSACSSQRNSHGGSGFGCCHRPRRFVTPLRSLAHEEAMSLFQAQCEHSLVLNSNFWAIALGSKLIETLASEKD